MIEPYDKHRIVHIKGVDHPESIAIGPRGEAYTTGTGCQVYRVDLERNAVSVFASTRNRCLGQAVDAAGNLYCAETVLGAVVKITPDGQLSTYASGPDKRPFMCANYPAFDRCGNMYLSDSGDWSGQLNGRLYKIPPGGGPAGSAPGCPGSAPAGGLPGSDPAGSGVAGAPASAPAGSPPGCWPGSA